MRAVARFILFKPQLQNLIASVDLSIYLFSFASINANLKSNGAHNATNFGGLFIISSNVIESNGAGKSSNCLKNGIPTS